VKRAQVGPRQFEGPCPEDGETGGCEAQACGSHSGPILGFVGRPDFATQRPIEVCSRECSWQDPWEESRDGTHTGHPYTCHYTRTGSPLHSIKITKSVHLTHTMFDETRLLFFCLYFLVL
jgi:hypothetical protein